MIERRFITDRDQWLEWRQNDVTASEVASVFGLSPFKSTLQLWAEKTGRVKVKASENLLMRRGRWLEPAVLTALAETYPHETVEKLNVYLRDPQLRLGATPDGLLGSRRIVEAKVIARPVFESWPNDDPPIYYVLQALTGAMLKEAEAAVLACLVLDTYSADLVLFHVQRDEKAEMRLRDGVDRFWHQVAAGEMPAADYGEDGALLSVLYGPKGQLATIDLSSDNYLPELLIERQALVDRVKADEARIDAIKAELVDKLKGAPVGVCGNWTIANKIVHRKETIQAAVSFPVLRVSQKREAAA